MKHSSGALTGVTVVKGNLNNPQHSTAIISLINEYRNDPMGGNLPNLTSTEEVALVNGLKNHPVALVLLAVTNDQIVGMTINFLGFSTFKAKNLLNIHDLIVRKHFRGRGVGRLLLKETARFARELNCCRLTLEVRNDNTTAKKLYSSVGFTPCDAPMEFWINPIG